MLFAAFKSLARQFLVISGILISCALIVWLVNGAGVQDGLQVVQYPEAIFALDSGRSTVISNKV